MSDVKMKIKVQSELNEEQRVENQKELLKKMFRRQLAKCIGRGALTLGTEQSLPTEKLKIPEICNEAFLDMSAIVTQLEEDTVPN